MLGRALAAAAVNQLGRDTGQTQRLRTVTPHRLFLSMVSTLGSGRVESLADVLRACNHQQGVDVAYKAFDNRLARVGFATFLRGMLARLIDQLRLQTLAPDGQQAVARFTDIVIRRVLVCAQGRAVGPVSRPVHDDRTRGGGSPRHRQWIRR
jgi:hypothetical protein